MSLRPPSPAGSLEYEAVFRAVPGSYLLLDPSFTILGASDAYCSATRTTRESLVGRPFFEVFSLFGGPDDASAGALRASLERALATRRPDRCSLQRHAVEKGSRTEERFVRPCSSPVLDEAGEIGGLLLWIEDVTEYVRLKRRYRFLADAVPLSLFTAAPDGKIDYCNARFRETTGAAPEGILGDAWLELVHDDDREATRAAWREAVATGSESFHVEHRIRQRDGTHRTHFTTARPYRDASGALQKWFGASADVHDRVLADERLRQAQRLQAAGKLASGFAHEVNNMMSVVVSSGEFALRTLVPGHPARADVEEMLKAAQRATEVTRQLLAYSRQQVLRPVVIDVRELVEGLVPALRRLVRGERRIETTVPDERAPVRIDRVQMELVLINLVANARDATGTDGHIAIGVAFEPDRSEESAVGPRRLVRVAVHDDGRGMEPDVASRAFEPFFTTKELGHGTGLGLSMVYGVVQQSGGFVEIDSAPGAGTTITIHLPLADEDPATEHARLDPALTGSERILVVEDDRVVRRLVHRALEGHGYTVFEAPTGLAALDFMARHGGEVDLVLTDVVMPRMSGAELYEQLRRTHPELPVVFMSGYTGPELLARGFHLAGAPLLHKPFAMDALLWTLREQLDVHPAKGGRGGGREAQAGR